MPTCESRVSTSSAASYWKPRSGVHRFGDLRSDAMHRVEAGQRILEDHRQHAAAHTAKLRIGHAQQIVSLQPCAALCDMRRLRQQAQQREAGQRFPDPLSPTMASVSPARSEKRDIAHGMDRAKRRIDLDVMLRTSSTAPPVGGRPTTAGGVTVRRRMRSTECADPLRRATRRTARSSPVSSG